MLNRAQLIGHLGGDPDVRHTTSGKSVCLFSLATSESWKDRETGERRERTEWHRIVVWSEGLIKVCEQFLRKGSRIFVEGKIATRKWQDESGKDRYSTEIVLQGFDARLQLLDRKSGGKGPDSPDDYGRGDSYGVNRPLDDGDEIPF
jgi:single-strand DNA-binding protein